MLSFQISFGEELLFIICQKDLVLEKMFLQPCFGEEENLVADVTSMVFQGGGMRFEERDAWWVFFAFS